MKGEKRKEEEKKERRGREGRGRSDDVREGTERRREGEMENKIRRK